jgi:hypothetical protein
VKIAIFLEMTGEITVSVFKNAPTIPKKHHPVIQRVTTGSADLEPHPWERSLF